MKPNPKPEMCGQIILSRMCNIRHTFCFQSTFEADRLPDEVLYERLRPLYEKTDRMRLIGGETLVIPGIKEYVVWLTDNYPHLHLELVTNGILLDEDWVELALARPLTFQVSLNTLSEDIAALIIRGPAARKHQRRLLENLGRLIAADRTSAHPLIQCISMVYGSDTAPGLEDMVAFALEHGLNLAVQNLADENHRILDSEAEAEALKMLKLLYFASDYINTMDYHTPHRIKQQFAQAREAGEYEAEKEVYLRDMAGRQTLRKSRTPFTRYLFAEQCDGQACRMPHLGFSINPDGGFHSCCHMHLYQEGNVKVDRVEDILTGQRRLNLQNLIESGDYLYCWNRCEFVARPETCGQIALIQAYADFDARRYAQARPILEDAVRRDGRNPETLYRLARCLEEEGLKLKAREYANQAASLGYPKAAGLLERLGAMA